MTRANITSRMKTLFKEGLVTAQQWHLLVILIDHAKTSKNFKTKYGTNGQKLLDDIG